MNDVALREYIEAEIASLRRELALQREADQRAVELASRALGAKLDSMNEFRNQIRDERSNYVRVDTFKWTIGFIVSLIIAISAIAPFVAAVIRQTR